MTTTAADNRRPFLTAEWRNLVVVNWRVAPELLLPWLPAGTVLDDFGGSFFMSLVGFHFARTKLWGAISLPGLTSFDEVNLRFYVRREVGTEVQRGVCFVRETVPSHLIASTARILYSEPYVRRAMRHSFEERETDRRVTYEWRETARWFGLSVQVSEPFRALAPGSLEEFILEHYWGYTKLSNTTTGEYRVQHPPWWFAPAQAYAVELGDRAYFGKHFVEALSKEPHSAFLAEGSPVQVFSRNLLSKPPGS